MVATAMASSHMRMRFQSPMLTTSDTAPMVQKCVLLPTAPKRKASAKAPHTTADASAAGLDAVTALRRNRAAGEPVRRCYLLFVARRSEERRVGKECRSGGWREAGEREDI